MRIFEISNQIVTSVFDSIRNEHNYSKFSNTYRHQFLICLTEWRWFFTLATTPSKHSIYKGVQENDVSVKMCMCTVLLLTMVQVLYLLEVFTLAHYYGPPSTETPTTETTIVQCHKNSWIYFTSTYYWWLLRPTITIRFDSKFQIIAQHFDSIRNEKTLFAQHYMLLLLLHVMFFNWDKDDCWIKIGEYTKMWDIKSKKCKGRGHS